MQYQTAARSTVMLYLLDVLINDSQRAITVYCSKNIPLFIEVTIYLQIDKIRSTNLNTTSDMAY